ncbi:MAG TPA: LamG-like jellyroll fold domain-containing protein [Verrucomicrobiae bacterium]|nr:LamG-like jellyroll fold domain-containing protein [Verrucomicrobiae bacterium]
MKTLIFPRCAKLLFWVGLVVSIASNTPGQGVYRELWTGLTTSLGNNLAALTNTTYNPNWPDNPDPAYTRIFTDFETEINLLSNYGQRVRTFVVPPVDGAYSFWIASDDTSQLFLSTDESPANKLSIAGVAVWTDPRQWTKEPNQKSAPITLQAGRRYYLEAIMQEGNGGDNLAVRWQLPTGSFEEPLTDSSPAGTHLIPCTGINSTPGFFVQPTNTSVAEGANAKFFLLATNQSPMTYQWQRSNTNLPGATQSLLTFSNTSSLADNGSVFRCIVSNPSGSVTSAPVTLTVIGDNTPPTLVSAINQDLTHIAVSFSEPIEAASGTNATNYTVSGGVTVSSGALLNPQTVVLTVSPLTLSNTYTLTVNNVRDRASTPNTIVANSQINFQARAFGLAARPPVGPFLNNVLPEAAPAIPPNWSVVPAFPNLVFTNALGFTHVPGTNLNCVWEREGRVWFFPTNEDTTQKWLVLDISNQCQGWDDSGLLNLAFHPGYTTNGFLFVYYTWVTPGTVVGSPTTRPTEMVVGKYHDRLSRFTLTSGAFPLGSELVFVDQTGDSVWHNGGGMFFHPVDGFLYYVDGDDERSPAQVIDNKLFAGLFRIDVDMRGGAISHPIPRQPVNGTTANYYIPNDNPFVGQPDVLEEFFGLGLRSPHRMTIDPPTGKIYIGDVGAGSREEITVVHPGESGLNFQWSYCEGFLGSMPANYIGVSKPPILDYPRNEGVAVIGGHVYRGSQFSAQLGGRYIFGDNVSRVIWVMDESTTPATKIAIAQLPKGDGPNSGSDYTGLSSFGLDVNNEIYMCQMSSIGGRIYKLAPGAPVASRPLPTLLSETGAFTNLATLAPNPGLIPYTVNSPLWSDAAHKTRWMAVPTNTLVTFASTGGWTFPSGTVFVKHFELSTNDTNPTLHRRLETRLLVRDTNGLVYGATYKWRPDNSDADLVSTLTNENILITTATGTRTQVWSYPGRQDCIVCHTIPSGGVLGVNTRQLNGEFAYPQTGVTDNQLRALDHISLFSSPLNEPAIPTYAKLVPVTDTNASLELRVRSYLDANCSHCHRPNGGVNALFDARFDTPLENQGLINGPVLNNLGISGARVVFPTNLAASLLYLRDNSLGVTKMPPLAKNTIDQDAVAIIAAWINSLVVPIPEFVARYQFEGNALDTSGNANHGTANNVTYASGNEGAQGAELNGTSSYVEIPRSISTDFTVAMWVRTTDTGGTGQWWSGKGLVDGEVNGSAPDWGAVVLNGRFALGVGSPDTTISSSVTINDGNWHHLVATRDNTSGAMNVYVDGALSASGTGPTGARTGPPSLRIGSIQTGVGFGYLNGTIDDVRLYDRVLSETEVAALLLAPAPQSLTAVPGDGRVTLNWAASSGATSYHLKRSTVSGSGYTTIATNSSTTFTNTGLANGTIYHFVVSALNAYGESPNSAQASARPVSTTPTPIVFAVANDQIQLSWPPGHTGWTLQVQTNTLLSGLGTNWITLPGTAETNQFAMPVDAANDSVFFRLIYP